ncbi:molybdopterin-dependent oxidoreductase [Spongiactinospora sp. 9N601]|uniref:molybdopterin-dependent oxidoreductase n=1 Tax=Spongiactinospora sp. 9N601 TaxID=3375149 RepID=UPI0037890841
MHSDERRAAVPAWAAVLCGLTAGAVALGVAATAAGLVDPAAFPVAAVGNTLVDVSPGPLKDWANRTFGSSNKAVVIAGVSVLLALGAAGIGRLVRRRGLPYGLAGLAAFGALGLAAVLTRPGASAVDAVPTLLGVLAGGLTLALLDRRALTAVAPMPGTPATPGAPTASGEPDHEGERPAVMRAGGPAPGFDRRALLGGVAGGVVLAGAGGVAGALLGGHRAVDAARNTLALPRAVRPATPLPRGADLRIPGLSPFVTPNSDFYRVDTAFVVPRVDPRDWTLRVHGMVDRPVEISFTDLLRRPLVEADVTLTCVSNEVGGPYVGNARWLGVRMADVLREARPHAGADMLLSTSADGWTCGTPLEVVLDGRDALFAVGMNGEPLPTEHGFPVRQVVPGLYGYVSATKWVVDVKVTRFDRDTAYWTSRGWAAEGPIKTQSRIDVPASGTAVPAGRTVIAGVAWAQHRGVAGVEVRVDRGEWREARLAGTPGPDTWRQWSIEADLRPGGHTIAVRATDGTGRTQPAQTAPPVPDGASGYHVLEITAT